jgi:hypothetical protein
MSGGVMDREGALEHFLENHLFGEWLNDLPQIDDTYSSNKEDIESGLLDAFDLVCRKAAKLQEEGRKGPVRYVYISLLRTRVMENAGVYRLDAYDESWFLDKAECSSTWEAGFLFDPLFRRMEGLEEKKSLYARKITSMDLDRIKQIEAVKYHLLGVELMRGLVRELIGTQGYQLMQKSPKLIVAAGEFRDQTELLYERNETEAP